MSNDRPWSKFFWSDWESDERLRQCSLAAQGLWMRMLCICAKGEPTGYLAIAGNPLDASGVARSAGITKDEAESLMAELEAWGVFSRDRKGRIYSRRMVKDVKKSKTAQKNGKHGGNPDLGVSPGKSGKNGASDNPQDKGHDKPQRPEARSQRVETDDADASSEKTKPQPLPDDWWPSDLDWQVARKAGLTDEEIEDAAREFRDYWHGQRRKSAGRKKDWPATWRNRVRDIASRRKRSPAGQPPQGNGQQTGSLVGVTRKLVHGSGG